MGVLSLFNNYLYEIIFISCILFLLVFGIYRFITGKKGSWSNSFFYKNEDIKQNTNKRVTESKGERECRRVLEKLTNRPFPKQRPQSMNNLVTKVNLELDCYNDELKIACEYNGIQHYKFTPYFHKNNEAFMNQKYRDQMKRDLCERNGIRLIEVPYSIKHEDIEPFLIKELFKLRN